MLAKIKGLNNYIFAAFFLTIFALYCSGRVGWFLLLALLLTPLTSMLLTKVAARSLTAAVRLNAAELDKGNVCDMEVALLNRSLFPIPYIEIMLLDNPHVKVTGTDKRPAAGLSLLPHGEASFVFSFRAFLAGGSDIGIERIRISDYFGILHFDVPAEQIEGSPVTIGVLPDRVRAGSDEREIVMALQQAFQDNESEETLEKTSLTFGGFPGYEYREYVPGDPLKRINMKLSAKRAQLYVRLDEKEANGNVTMVLDPQLRESTDLPADPEHIALLEQDTLERTLGIAEALLLADFGVIFYYFDGKAWVQADITDEGALFALTRALSAARFTRGAGSCGDLPPASMLPQGSGMICCTPCMNEALFGAVKDRTKGSGARGRIFHALTGEWRRV